MQRTIIAAAATVAIATSVAPLQAANLYWKGGTGLLTDPNYTTDGVNAVAPAAVDWLHLGLGGVVTHSTTALSVGKLRVGHNDTAGNGTALPGFTGSATLTIDQGAQVSLTGGASGNASAALWVGNAQTGVLNIDGAGTTLTSNRLAVIGAGNSASASGTVNITNGGALVVTLGNINVGDRVGATGNGAAGHIVISGATSSITMSEAAADLNIGQRTRTSSVTINGGTVNVGDVVEVGTQSGSSTGSSLSISGGTLTHAGSFFVGRGNSIDSTVNISGDGVINTGARFLMGGSDGDTLTTGTATGSVVNHTGGTLNTTLDIRVGDANEQVTATNVYNFGGTGVINSTTGMYVGRQANGTFDQTGGTATLGGALQIGNREAAVLATNGLYRISGGTLTVNSAGNALSIAAKGTGEFRVVGDDATIDLNGNFVSGNTVDGVGTLGFEFEEGDGLSLVDVSGNATFAANSNLVVDGTTVAPTLNVYNLLTAATVVDNGLVFAGPVGWHHQIAAGGNGQILQAALPSTWAAPGSGDWNTTGDWTGGGVPSAIGAKAIFGGAIAAPSTVSTTGNVTVGSMRFDSANAYTIGGSGSVTWAATGGANGAALVATQQGSHAITVPVIMNSNTTVDTAAGSSISINALTMAAGKRITKTGGGLLTIQGPMANEANSGLAVDAGTVDVSADLGAGLLTPTERPDLSVSTPTAGTGAVVNLGSTQQLNNLAINPEGTANVLTGGDKTLVVNTLAIAATNAKLNMNDNDLIVDYTGASVEGQVRQWVKDGRVARLDERDLLHAGQPGRRRRPRRGRQRGDEQDVVQRASRSTPTR